MQEDPSVRTADALAGPLGYAVLHFCRTALFCYGHRVPLAKQSLRERKRAATWTAIHEAAASAALEHHDLSRVTIDEVAAQADISPRTFFNYFPSKEDAILGLRQPSIDDDTASSFVITDSDNLIEKVALLLFDVFDKTAGGPGSRELRRTLMHRHPVLAQIRLAHTERLHHLARALIEARLTESDRWQGRMHSVDVGATAQILVAAGQSVVRIAVEWMLNEPEGNSPLDELVHRAAQAFTTVLEEA
jgi:AcrR family transcriptional regulator